MKRDPLLSEEHLNQEVTVALRVRDLLRLVGDDLPAEAAPFVPAATAARDLPTVGAEWHGGKYAGLTLDGDHLAALILLPGDFQGTFAEAKDWAEKEDGVLPSRHDQLVLFKNMKSEFKDAWYWSGEQPAGDADFAWCQDFSSGTQDWLDVSFRYRARAVRRIPIR